MSKDYPGKVFPVTAKDLGAFVAEQKALQTPGSVYHVPKSMTDRDRLAEKLYVYYAYHNASDETLIEGSKYAIKAAGVFFNQLEANNNG